MSKKVNSFIAVLIALLAACLMLTSCTGLLTLRAESSGITGIRIELTGDGTTRGAAPEGIDYYTVAILKQDTDEVVAGPDTVTDGAYEKELDPGNYCVVIQAIDSDNVNWINGGLPLRFGRKENVAVTVGHTTKAVITMVPLSFEGDYVSLTQTSNIAIGKPPVAENGDYDLDKWYFDFAFTKPAPYFPDTTNLASVELYPRFTKFFYANSTGGGDGTSADSPLEIGASFGALLTFASSHPAITSTLILTSDVTLPGSGAFISCKVEIVGNGHTIKGTSGYVAQFGSEETSPTCKVSNVIVDGESSKQGIINYGNLTLENCTIRNCKINESGAAIYTTSNLTIEGCTFEDCFATSYNGGAVAATSSSGGMELTIKDSTFFTERPYSEISVPNTANYGGYIYYNVPSTESAPISTITLTGCDFTNGYATTDGGAVYVSGKANVTMTECDFLECRITGGNSGNASSCNGINNLSITECSFSDCVGYSGLYGTVYATGSGTGTISDCTFTNCLIKAQGGALCASSFPTFSIDKCTFTECSTHGDRFDDIPVSGGAIYLSDTQASLKDCTFTTCSSVTGAGVSFVSSSGTDYSLSLAGTCKFLNGTAIVSGGGLAMQGGSLSFAEDCDCLFKGCTTWTTATDYETGVNINYGGGLCITGTSSIVFFDDCQCTFESCSSVHGGGLSICQGSANTIRYCTFTGCTATTSGASGGGAYIAGTSGNTTTIAGCSFSNCSTEYNGGACSFMTAGNYTVTSCTFSSCSAIQNGGAIYGNASGGKYTISGSTTTACSAENGKAAWLGGNGKYVLNGGTEQVASGISFNTF